MAKYRKKPVTIDAITFDELVEHGKRQVPEAHLVNGMPWSFTYNGHAITHERDDCYLIPTLEGTRHMTPVDMLITGVKGEIYPCKREIFESTYDAAAPAPTRAPTDNDIEAAARPPHQQRVIDEKDALDKKIEKLAAFVQPTNAIFQGLPNAEAGRLTYQLSVMGEYSRVLGDRIAAF